MAQLAEWLRKRILENILPLGFSEDNSTKTNCYAYSLGLTDTWLKLGAVSGVEEDWDIVSPSKVIHAFESDMRALDITILQKLRRGDSPQLDFNQLLVGVYWASNDYHFIRFNKDGKWSHKPGPQPVKRLGEFPPYQLGRYEYICSYLLEV